MRIVVNRVYDPYHSNFSVKWQIILYKEKTKGKAKLCLMSKRHARPDWANEAATRLGRLIGIKPCLATRDEKKLLEEERNRGFVNSFTALFPPDSTTPVSRARRRVEGAAE